jgi:hypothetical protein
MALNRIETDGIEDDAITTAKILDGTVGPADIGDGELTNTQISASAAIATSKISGLGTAATLDFGTGANQVLQLDGSGNLPAVNASALTNLDAGDLTPSTLPALNGSNLTNLTAANIQPGGVLPVIDGSNLTGVSTDTTVLENNIAILAFKTQTSNNLAKFNLIGQVIDEYYDTTGIDAGASSGEVTSGSGIAKYYQGGTQTIPGVSITGTGNTTTIDGEYSIHKFITTGNYVNNTAQSVEYLVVAGGGAGGGSDYAGGGGAGGYRAATGLAVSAATHTITVGLGGTAVGTGTVGTSGGTSSLAAYIVSAGGGGGAQQGGTPTAGGSGGASANQSSIAGAAGNTPSTSPVQGYAGGRGTTGLLPYTGGGGGGSSAVGVTPGGSVYLGTGGAGTANDIIETGTNVTYAGGGGGASNAAYTGGGLGGSGGGGRGGGNDGSPAAGVANTGSGGGGASNAANGGVTSGAGGKGIVVIRRLTAITTVGANLILQSVANTALTSPTTGDVVMLIENAGSGTAVLGTNIKVFVSRNGGAAWDEATGSYALADKGTWGSGTKKIITANNIPFTGAAGTDMRYKIQTLAQSAGTMETRIHATSLAWA